MEKLALPRRALILWRVRDSLLVLLAGFIFTLIFSERPFWHCLFLAVSGVVFLFFFCVYHPLKLKKFCYFFINGQLTVDCGVFYNRRRAIPLKNIQSVTIFRGPAMMAFSLSSVAIHSAGATIYIPCLFKDAALSLQENLLK